jgi:uncharacterized protein YecE (DUF72 family)
MEENNVRIGCSGWSIPKEFSSEFSTQGSHLERYSKRLSCTEINSSFYRPHRQQTWERWAASVPERFRFSVKAPKAITHDASLACSRTELKTFLKQLQPLGEKLGPLLFQLPPSLEFQATSAKKFLSLLRELHPGEVVWEPRHKSWFEDPAEELLTGFEIARVAADPAVVSAASDPSGWRKLSYFRLHGAPRRYYSSYNSDFLNALAMRIVQLRKDSQVWCIFDNTASGAATSNALQLNSLMQKSFWSPK